VWNPYLLTDQEFTCSYQTGLKDACPTFQASCQALQSRKAVALQQARQANPFTPE